MNDLYFRLASEHYGYVPGSEIAESDLEVKALADFMRAKFGPLRDEFASLRMTLYGLALDARQAEVAQRAIDKIDAALRV